MDFCKLSQETIDLSEKIGPRQQQLLFDDHYYCDDVSFFNENDDSLSSAEEKAGIVFFIDKGVGSFCVRGVARNSFNPEVDRDSIISNNRHFEKAEDLLYFECPNIEIAQIVCDQIVNRRYPYFEESLCNISDPGPGWWLDYTSNSISIYFKLMGNKCRPADNIGPIGDPEIAKFRWAQAASFFKTIFKNVDCSQSEKGLFLKVNNEMEFSGKTYFDDLITLFSEGENNFSSSDFEMTMESQTLHLYFSELALTRKFWSHISSLI